MTPPGLKISVITAVYNGAQTLQRAIDSVSTQDYSNKELIVIDGGSSDGTYELLRSNNHVIDYWESKPDRGIYHAWNKALDHVTGDWIHFLGADDYYSGPRVLSSVAAGLRDADPGVRLAYGKVARVSNNGEVLSVWGEPWGLARRSLRKGLIPLPHLGVFHHRSLFETSGKWDETFRISGDYEFLLRVLPRHTPVFLPNVLVGAMTVGGVSTTTSADLDLYRENARARRLNGYKASPVSLFRGFAEAYACDKLFRALGEPQLSRVRSIYRRFLGRPSIP